MRKKELFTAIWQIIGTIVILFFDQMTKAYVLNNVSVGEVFGELPYVADYIFVKNTGAAFSILSDNTWLLSTISVIFVIAVLIYRIVAKPQGVIFNIALVLFFAGALGNAIDRIAYGYVVDFISIKWFDFPVFNIADMAIVMGAVLAVIHVIFLEKDGDKRNG